MKKIYIFLFVVIPFYSSFSQSELADISQSKAHFNREIAMREILNKNSLSLQQVLDSTLSWTWNESSGAWDIREKVINTYDAQGRLAEQIYYSWDEPMWEPSFKIIYSYTESEITEVVYTLESDTWVLYSQNISTYDSHGNLLQYVVQEWSGSEWRNVAMVIQEYNSQFKPILHLTSYWGSDMWIPDSRTTYTYNSGGLTDSTLFQLYETGEWVDNFRQAFTYDGSDRVIHVQSEVFNGAIWKLSGQIIYEYSMGTITLTNMAYQMMQWVNLTQVYSVYDMDDNLYSEVFRIWNDEWTNGDSTQYYYSELSASHDIAASSEIGLYPNPAADFLTIDVANLPVENTEVHIFSILGIEEIQLNLNTKTQVPINVSQLASGQYIVFIKTNNILRRAGFIKQ